MKTHNLRKVLWTKVHKETLNAVAKRGFINERLDDTTIDKTQNAFI